VVDYRSLVQQASAAPGSAPAWAPPGALQPPGQSPDAARSPASPYPPAPPPARALVFGLWALLGALALHTVWGAAAAAAVGLVAARTVWMAIQSLNLRRFRRGQRPSDPARVAFGLPWHLLRGLVGALPALALGAAVGLGGYCGLVYLGGLRQSSAEVAAAAVACGLAVAWWGPSGAETRHGARAALRGLLRTAPRRSAAALALLVSAAAVLATWPW
jgi:hypothetical protein